MSRYTPVPTQGQSLSLHVSEYVPEQSSTPKQHGYDYTPGRAQGNQEAQLGSTVSEGARLLPRNPVPNHSVSATPPDSMTETLSDLSSEHTNYNYISEHNHTYLQENLNSQEFIRREGHDEGEVHAIGQENTGAPKRSTVQEYGDGHDSQTVYLTTKGYTSTPSLSSLEPRPSFIHRLWLWELGASVFSLVCIASVVGILVYEQGKPLDQWGLHLAFFSPTVVVSYLGTLGKSSCLLALAEIISQLKWLHFKANPQKLSDLQMFDNASRGPWGALQLALFKNRKALLATCASLIVLASLLVEPFIQSVFYFPNILTQVQGATSSILASQIYDPSSLPVRNEQCEGPAAVDSTMQAAILSPIWNATRAPSLPCGFERCEWPTITTLGVCSSCVDLTNTVIQSCVIGKSLYNKVNCSFTVPSSGSTLNAVLGVTGGAAEQTDYSTLWNSVAGSGASTWKPVLSNAWNIATPKFNNSEPAIVSNFTFIKFPSALKFQDYVSEDGKTISKPLSPQAMQCTFSICARTFTNAFYANFSASKLTGPETPLVTASNGTTNGNEVKVLVGLEPASLNYPPMNTTFQINYCDYNDIGLYLQDLFTVADDTTGLVGTTTDTSSTGLTDAGAEKRVTPNMGLAFSQTDDIPALMQGIADSMTEAFRTSPNSTAVDGVGKTTVTFIAITWAWLALPIFFVVSTFIMLVVIIIRNNARGVPIWKSSSLALLFYEIDGWEKPENGFGSSEDIKEQASKMTAQVKDENNMLLFSVKG